MPASVFGKEEDVYGHEDAQRDDVHLRRGEADSDGEFAVDVALQISAVSD